MLGFTPLADLAAVVFVGVLGWSIADPGILLEWREVGGPPVLPPAQTGFGTSLANAAFPPERGEVSFDYRADGLRCTVSLLAARSLVAPIDQPSGIVPSVRAAPL